MASTHYQIFCRYYHSSVNRAVMNTTETKWYSGSDKNYSDLARSLASKKGALEVAYSDIIVGVMPTGISKNYSKQFQLVNTSVYDSSGAPVTDAKASNVKRVSTDKEMTFNVGTSVFKVNNGNLGTVTAAGSDYKVKMKSYEDGTFEIIYTGNAVTSSTVTVSVSFTAQKEIKELSSESMTNKSDFTDADGKQKMFFRVDEDYNNSYDEAIENIWIRFEDCVQCTDKSDKRQEKVLEIKKEARTLDSMLSEIIIEESKSNNPKYDMIFLYDGIASEMSTTPINTEGCGINEIVRTFKWVGKPTSVKATFYASVKQWFVPGAGGGEGEEGGSIGETRTEGTGPAQVSYTYQGTPISGLEDIDSQLDPDDEDGPKYVTSGVYAYGGETWPGGTCEVGDPEDDDGTTSTSLTVQFNKKKAPYKNFKGCFTFTTKRANNYDKTYHMKEESNIIPYVYYDKFVRMDLSPWFIYANTTSLKWAMSKLEELVGIIGTENVILGKVVDLDQYIEIA